VTVKSSIEKLGMSVLTVGGLNSPVGVAVNQRVEVVVGQFWCDGCTIQTLNLLIFLLWYLVADILGTSYLCLLQVFPSIHYQ